MQQPWEFSREEFYIRSLEYSCTHSIMCLKIGPILQATAYCQPNEYGCVHDWTTLENIATLLLPILVKKKNHLLRWSTFWFWQVCKQTKLSHLVHRKLARTHWKADTPKTSHCLEQSLVQRHTLMVDINSSKPSL